MSTTPACVCGGCAMRNQRISELESRVNTETQRCDELVRRINEQAGRSFQLTDDLEEAKRYARRLDRRIDELVAENKGLRAPGSVALMRETCQQMRARLVQQQERAAEIAGMIADLDEALGGPEAKS